MAAPVSASVQKMNELAQNLRASMPEGDRPASASSATAAVGSGTSPKGARKGALAGARRRSQSGGELLTADAAQLASDYEVVRHRYEEVLKENETLKSEQKRRMESYMRRETNYQSEIEDLKAELERQRQTRPAEGEQLAGLRSQHRKVMDVLGSMQSREQLSLQEQEKDLLRAFRARLWDVQFELESERSKKDDGALEWIEKTKTLGKELDWSRDEALRLDRMNQALMKETTRLKSQLRAQEDDREFIMRQMLTLKKENSRLKASASTDALGAADGDRTVTAGAPGGRSHSAGVRRGVPDAGMSDNRPMTAGTTPFRGLEEVEVEGGDGGGASLASAERVKELMLQQAESEERYREVVARLKRLLDVERRNLRAVRAAHAKDLQSRTELETLLRACVDDVRKEVATQRRMGSSSMAKGGASTGPSASARLVAVDELGPKERERVLELLLSQERVVSLLYERSFAVPSAGTPAAAPVAEPDEESEEAVGGP